MGERFINMRKTGAAVSLIGLLAAGCASQIVGSERDRIVQGLVNDGYDTNDFDLGEITKDTADNYTMHMGLIGCDPIDATIAPLGIDKWTVMAYDQQPEDPNYFRQLHGC